METTQKERDFKRIKAYLRKHEGLYYTKKHIAEKFKMSEKEASATMVKLYQIGELDRIDLFCGGRCHAFAYFDCGD